LEDTRTSGNATMGERWTEFVQKERTKVTIQTDLM
jgi:hypothetical protein